MDKRGLTWGMIDNPPDPSWDLLGKIEAMNYKEAPWSTAYPALAAILDNGWEDAKSPRGNTLHRNIGWQNNSWTTGDGLSYLSSANNITNQNPLFVDEASLNLALQDNSPAYTIPGFVRIPFELIGNLDHVQATRPNPHVGRIGVPLTARFYWAPSAQGRSRDIYLGTDYDAVFHATTASPEFQGNTTETSFGPDTLGAGQTYYWRIDEYDPEGNLLGQGAVWSFTTQSSS
jgi:hypothetical protein